MRYEHIELTLSTVACDALRTALSLWKVTQGAWGFHENAIANMELHNLFNELEARLQRHDQDPHAKVPEPEGPYCSVDCKAFHVANEKTWDLTA